MATEEKDDINKVNHVQDSRRSSQPPICNIQLPESAFSGAKRPDKSTKAPVGGISASKYQLLDLSNQK